MSEDALTPDWPDETEEVAAAEATKSGSANLSDLAPKRLAEDEEDTKYVLTVNMLYSISAQHPAILGLSDGVTNHCVVARDVVADGRTYWIYYHDPWRPHRGSFLQSGKNVAGVEARSVPDRPGLWVITHEELMRVLDSVITTAPTEEAEAAPET